MSLEPTSYTNSNPAILTVTSTAIDKIKGLLEEKQLLDHGLRVFVTGGGCSGYQYGMAFENDFREDDNLMEIDGVKLVVDAGSLPFIRGASIDFIDDLMGGGFKIDNPNAVSTCGCGSSFNTGEGGQTYSGSCGCG